MRETKLLWRQRVEIVLVVSILVGYPVVSMLPTLTGLDTRTVSVPYRAFVLLIALFVLFVDAISVRRRLRVGWPLGLFAACWCVLLLRYVNDVVLEGKAPSAYFEPTEFLTFVLGACLVPSIALFIRNQAGALKVIHTSLIVLSACVVSVYSWFFGSDYWQLRAVADAESIRFQSESLNAITYGSLGAILILTTLTYRFAEGRYFLKVPVTIGAVSLGSWALITSASRGPLFALVAALLPLAYVVYRRKSVPLPVMLGVLAVFLGIVFAFTPSIDELSAGSLFASRIFGVVEDRSTLERMYILQGAWDIFLNDPLTGGAIVEPTTLAYPHNIVVEGLMVGGLGMGAMVISILVTGLKAAWTFLMVDDERLFLSTLLIFNSVMTMTSGSLYTGTEYWAFFALAVAYWDVERPAYRANSSKQIR